MSEGARTLTKITAFGSAIFCGGLFWAASRYGSELALAQAADSLLDVAGAVVLAWVVTVAAAPGDERHPMGHARAEPLGALSIAMLAGVLALEVGSSAVRALLGVALVTPSSVLLAFFAAKVAFKAVVWSLARKGTGPAFSALLVDSRNDCLVGILAMIGYTGARLGHPAIDAWLALPASVWIGWSGFTLARENVDLLMGVAPEEARRRELLSVVASVPGVQGAHDLVAHYFGPDLTVHLRILVGPELSVRRAHDVGEDVRRRLLEEPDVSYCTVHIDPDDPEHRAEAQKDARSI